MLAVHEGLIHDRGGNNIRRRLAAIDMPNSMILAAGKYETMAEFWSEMTSASNMIYLMGCLFIGTASERIDIARAFIQETEDPDHPGSAPAMKRPSIAHYIETGKREPKEDFAEFGILSMLELAKLEAKDSRTGSPGLLRAVHERTALIAMGLESFPIHFRADPRISAQHADIIRRFIPSPFG